MDERGAGKVVEIHILFGSRRDAERRIAGVRALARIAREFEAAEISQVMVVLEDGSELSPSLRADLLRVAPGVQVAVAEAGTLSGADTVAFTGEHLIPAEAIRRFLDGEALALIWRGQSVARRCSGEITSSGGPPDTLAPDDVIPLHSAAAASWALLRRSGKTSDGPVARWLNRPISRPLSFLCLTIPWLRPNHVTALTAAIAVAMFACFLWGDPAVIVLGGVLFHVASVVDGVDGEMARVSFRSSMGGAMFDIIVDRLTILAFFLGIPIAMARTEGSHHALVGGWGFAAAAIGCLILARVLRRIEPPRSYWVMEKVVRARFPKPPAKWIVDFLATCIKRDVFSFVFPLLMVLGLSWSVTWLFTGFTTLWLGVVFATTPAILRGGVQPRSAPAALPTASGAV